MKRWYHWAGLTVPMKSGWVIGITLVMAGDLLDMALDTNIRGWFSCVALVAMFWALLVEEWDDPRPKEKGTFRSADGGTLTVEGYGIDIDDLAERYREHGWERV